MEVAVWNKDDCVMTRVGTKGEDASNGSVSSCNCAVVTGSEASFNACAAREGKEGDDEVIRVWDGVNVDGVVVSWRIVGKVGNGRCSSLRGWEGEGIEDSGVRPCETCRNAEHREGGGE